MTSLGDLFGSSYEDEGRLCCPVENVTLGVAEGLHLI